MCVIVKLNFKCTFNLSIIGNRFVKIVTKLLFDIEKITRKYIKLDKRKQKRGTILNKETNQTLFIGCADGGM